MPRCWGPEHRAHTTPHTRQLRPVGERQRCAPALNTPPPADPSARGHTGTAASPSHQRLGGVRGSSAVWTAVRPDNQRGVPSRAGEVRAHWPWVTAFGASRDPNQTKPSPSLPRLQLIVGGRGRSGQGPHGSTGDPPPLSLPFRAGKGCYLPKNQSALEALTWTLGSEGCGAGAAGA
jgi:hypothetical protein